MELSNSSAAETRIVYPKLENTLDPLQVSAHAADNNLPAAAASFAISNIE